MSKNLLSPYNMQLMYPPYSTADYPTYLPLEKYVYPICTMPSSRYQAPVKYRQWDDIVKAPETTKVRAVKVQEGDLIKVIGSDKIVKEAEVLRRYLLFNRHGQVYSVRFKCAGPGQHNGQEWKTNPHGPNHLMVMSKWGDKVLVPYEKFHGAYLFWDPDRKYYLILKVPSKYEYLVERALLKGSYTGHFCQMRWTGAFGEVHFAGLEPYKSKSLPDPRLGT